MHLILETYFWHTVIGLVGLGLLFLLLSFLVKDNSSRYLEELRDYSFEQSQDIFELRNRLNRLEEMVGVAKEEAPIEVRRVNSLTKQLIIRLFEEGKTAENIAIQANVHVTTAQIIIDNYIEKGK